MKLQALGYVGVATRNLDDWTGFATSFLGMQLADHSRATRAFRMDDRKQRLVIQDGDGEGPAFYGWETASPAALDAVAADLEPAGVQIARGSPAPAAERRGRALHRSAGPAR